MRCTSFTGKAQFEAFSIRSPGFTSDTNAICEESGDHECSEAPPGREVNCLGSPPVTGMVHNCRRLFESGRVKAMIFPSGENLGDPSEGPWVKVETSPFDIAISLILDSISLDVPFTSDSTNIS